MSKNTIVCKKKRKKITKKFLGTSRLLSLPYVVILLISSFIIPFVFYTYITVNRITYVNYMRTRKNKGLIMTCK